MVLRPQKFAVGVTALILALVVPSPAAYGDPSESVVIDDATLELLAKQALDREMSSDRGGSLVPDLPSDPALIIEGPADMEGTEYSEVVSVPVDQSSSVFARCSARFFVRWTRASRLGFPVYRNLRAYAGYACSHQVVACSTVARIVGVPSLLFDINTAPAGEFEAYTCSNTTTPSFEGPRPNPITLTFGVLTTSGPVAFKPTVRVVT